MKRPLCRYCGNPIPKRTNLVFVLDADSVQRITPFVPGPLYSKAECQRQTNQQVASVSYRLRHNERRVSHFTTWDSESYADKYFCKGACAQQFAYLMASNGHCTAVYNAAVARQREEIAA